MESREPESQVDIVKEVASALEEEEFTKNESATSTKVPTTTTSLPKKPPTFQLPLIAPSNLQQNKPTSSSKISASPPLQTIRSDDVSGQKPQSKASEENQPTSGSTWQDSSSKTDPDDGGGMWGWMSNAVSAGLQTTQSIGRNIVEKTKSSVDTVITTLDPEMEDYLYNRGEAINLTLTTEDLPTIQAVRDGFRQVFELAFFKGCSSSSGIAPMPSGCSAGLKGAQHRASHLRRAKKVKEDEVIVGVEELIAELVPGKWFSMICLYLNDPNLKIDLQTFSQALEVPKQYITKAEESTPSNYNLRWSGLSYTLGEVILGSGNSHGDWQSKVGGCSRKQILTLAARTLAGQYRNIWNEKVESVLDKAVVL